MHIIILKKIQEVALTSVKIPLFWPVFKFDEIGSNCIYYEHNHCDYHCVNKTLLYIVFIFLYCIEINSIKNSIKFNKKYNVIYEIVYVIYVIKHQAQNMWYSITYRLYTAFTQKCLAPKRPVPNCPAPKVAGAQQSCAHMAAPNSRRRTGRA